MLGQGQYNEFTRHLHLLIEPFLAAAPHVVFRPYNGLGQGRPGILALGARTSSARYQFRLSILIRWRDSSILNFLEANDFERKLIKAKFVAGANQLLNEIEIRYRVDWRGGSQDSPQALTIDLEEI
jgi:hypothetical protein